MLLYLIRHGDPVYVTDTLTERGRLQAEAVGKRLAASGIDRVFASSMGRAQETAMPLCRMIGKEYTVEHWAREVGEERMTTYPDGIVKSVSAIQNTAFRQDGSVDLPYDRYMENIVFKSTRLDEAVEYIEREGNEFLERLGYRYENGVYRIVKPSEERVALFCHAVFTRTWLSVLLHIPLHLVTAGFQTTHTGVTVLEFKNNEDGFTAPKCLCFSDVSHLYAEGLDIIHDNKIGL